MSNDEAWESYFENLTDKEIAGLFAEYVMEKHVNPYSFEGLKLERFEAWIRSQWEDSYTGPDPEDAAGDR